MNAPFAIHAAMLHTSPVLNGSSVLQCFKRGKVVEMCNGIMLDFYPRLLHILTESSVYTV